MLIHDEITEKILRAFFEVYNTLGYGFLEKVYENALFNELTTAGLRVERQHPIEVGYKRQIVGVYCADLLVENLVIVELKAADALREEHECQLLNYLKATGIQVGLLLNFGKTPQFKRKIFSGSA